MLFRCLGICFNSRLCVRYVPLRLYASSVSLPTESGCSTADNRTRILSDALQCSYKTARLITKKNKKILTMDSFDLQEAAAFCKNNFRLSDVIESPNIITLPSDVLDYRMQSLSELGFNRISANHVVRFQKFFQKFPDRQLSKELASIGDAIPDIFNELEIAPSMLSEFREEVREMHSKDMSLMNIKAEINRRFLQWRLSVSCDKIDKACKRCAKLLTLNLKSLEASIVVLTERYQFTLAKIAQYPYILTVSSRRLEHLLQTVPSILGIDIHILAQKYPSLLARPPSSLKKIENLCSDFEISGTQLLQCPRVLRMKSYLLKHRLEASRENKELFKFKNNSSYLQLMINYKRLNQRLKLLHLSNVPYNLNMLVLPNAEFRKQLRAGRTFVFGKSIGKYLSEVFDCSLDCVQQNLKDYPTLYSCSITNAQDVTDFLFTKGVSKEQLWNGLGIIAYEVELVEQVFSSLPQCREFQPFSEWLGHFNLIQLLIYATERYGERCIDVASENANVDEDKDYAHESSALEEPELDYFSDEEEEIPDVYQI